jgi:hypothetical protein
MRSMGSESAGPVDASCGDAGGAPGCSGSRSPLALPRSLKAADRRGASRASREWSPARALVARWEAPTADDLAAAGGEAACSPFARAMAGASCAGKHVSRSASDSKADVRALR